MNNSPNWHLLIIVLLFASNHVRSQNQIDTTSNSNFTSIAVGALVADSIPSFWQKINTYGTVPTERLFSFLDVQIKRHYISKKNKNFHFYLSGHARGLAFNNPQVLLPEASFSSNYRNLSLTIGRHKEVIGLGDTLMSSGFYSVSSNALPIPKIKLASNGFIPLKFTKGLLAINFSLGHGWFGKQDFAQNYFLHQKTFFLRFTTPSKKFSLAAGVSHLVQWGGRAPLLIGTNRTGPNGELPNTIKDFWYVITAKKFPNASNLSTFDSENRVGNHLGSIDFLASFRAKFSVWQLYLQHPAENLPGVFSNFPDGLYGISWKNTRKGNNKFSISNIIVEHLTTLDQGLFFNPIINGYQGNGYFNNSQYMDGWTYKNHVIGTPFILTRFDTRQEWFNVLGSYSNGDYWKINGNSVSMWHFGIQGKLTPNTKFSLKIARSNYFFDLQPSGIYLKSGYQYCTFLLIDQELKVLKGISINTSIGYDQGNILPTSLSNVTSIKWYINHSR